MTMRANSTIDFFIVVFVSLGGKDNANQEQNKMNLFIFYAEVQLIFAFGSKDTIICCMNK